MKIILLQDVKSLGKKGDIAEVNDGYARNYILPKKLGAEANAANLNDLKQKKDKEERIAKEQLKAAQAAAKELETKEVTVKLKAGEGGRVFGSVSGKEIAAAFKEQCGLEIDKKKLLLEENIKSAGVYRVDIRLHPKVTGVVTVKVEEEK